MRTMHQSGLWWGESGGHGVAPVTLSDQKRLVYCLTRRPLCLHARIFEERSFPHNMDAVWNSHWLRAARDPAIVIGEMGGFYRGDQVWQDWAVDKCRREGYGVFYFELNPDSVDTGGILKDDWTTPIDAKLRLLWNLPSTKVAGLVPEQCLCASTPPPSPPSPSPPPLDWASLRCYAERYTDIMEGYCHNDVNKCPWPELYEHYSSTANKRDAREGKYPRRWRHRLRRHLYHLLHYYRPVRRHTKPPSLPSLGHPSTSDTPLLFPPAPPLMEALTPKPPSRRKHPKYTSQPCQPWLCPRLRRLGIDQAPGQD